jgi:hypothetical protein
LAAVNNPFTFKETLNENAARDGFGINAQVAVTPHEAASEALRSVSDGPLNPEDWNPEKYGIHLAHELVPAPAAIEGGGLASADAVKVHEENARHDLVVASFSAATLRVVENVRAVQLVARGFHPIHVQETHWSGQIQSNKRR